MLQSSFNALIVSTAYGLVLPGSIPSPSAAQIALAVGGGSVEPYEPVPPFEPFEPVPESEIVTKLKAELANVGWKRWYDVMWKEREGRLDF